LDPDRQKATELLVEQEVSEVCLDSRRVKENGCAACHVLFTIAGRMNLSEADAADLLSEVLTERPDLNDRFIEMVEQVHMKQRLMGVAFSIKTRDSKDRYIDSQLKNALDELLADAANYGAPLAVRKLVMAQVALQIAQGLGIDYHAATEELYYYMRKHDSETHEQVMKLVVSLLERGVKK
jgi:hypothetical protein